MERHFFYETWTRDGTRGRGCAKRRLSTFPMLGTNSRDGWADEGRPEASTKFAPNLSYQSRNRLAWVCDAAGLDKMLMRRSVSHSNILISSRSESGGRGTISEGCGPRVYVCHWRFAWNISRR